MLMKNCVLKIPSNVLQLVENAGRGLCFQFWLRLRLKEGISQSILSGKTREDGFSRDVKRTSRKEGFLDWPGS